MNWRNRRIESIGWHHGTVSGSQKAGWLVYFPKSCHHLTFSGTALLLVQSVLNGECPAGILLDRLEECPEEGGKPVSLVLAAVKYFRQHHQH